MKSKVLSVFLAVCTVFGMLAASGCSKKGNNDESEKSGIVTLNMFILTEEETAQNAAREVQMAINEITVPQYKMLVKINYLTEDEYWDAVDAAEEATISYVAEEIEALEEAEEGEEAADGENAEASDEKKVEVKDVSELSFNEAIDYVFEIDDVELTSPQIDVFVVNDYDKFVELVEDGRVAEIDTKYDRKVLTKYIHPTILGATSQNGKVYGVPTNFAMNGQYEFLVFNKDLLDKYGYSVHDLRKIEDMGDYLALIKQNEPGYYPISDLPEMVGAEIYDDILFSLSSLTGISNSCYPVYLNNNAYMDYLNKTASYRANGYVAAYNGVENAKYAIEYVTSDTLIEREWTDENGTTYQAYLYDIPRVTNEEAFASAMCVSAYSVQKSKAAELIELFNTDSELANLLQYGIEGTHYRVEDNIVTYIDTEPENTYRMNNLITGNTYIKYETEETAGYVEHAKESNLSTAPSAFFGFDLALDDVNSKSIYECVKTFSAEALDMVARGEMTVEQVFNIASRQLNAMGCKWDSSGSNLLGVFGKLANQQKTSAEKNTSFFVLSDEAAAYNEVYKSAEELAEEKAAEEKAKAEAEAEKEAEAEAALDAAIAAQNAADAAEDELLDETETDDGAENAQTDAENE